ncbi:hypothetical protein R3W88_000794 [Solanum pinnatisectum]|uniref:Pectinesterase inhibitor domain-containing protein n=1 Tax=Solanum pinnatisectum TaxID=50273 RepID=A0AAV9MK41_9SOLN|nr:hypothetical protein R3W88_000794 [Solanum pinnatisectum]
MTHKIYAPVKMNSSKALIVMFTLFLSLVTYSYFKVCMDALRSDPKSSSVDKKCLVRILLQQCLIKTKSIYNEIVSLLEQAKEFVLIQCLQVCKENYDLSIDNAETTIKDFNANDFPGARSSAGGVASARDTCEETFNEPPVRISPIKSKDDDLMNFIDLTEFSPQNREGYLVACALALILGSRLIGGRSALDIRLIVDLPEGHYKGALAVKRFPLEEKSCELPNLSLIICSFNQMTSLT